MAAKPELLFVAPILPAPAGNGLAMRAGMFLDALAQDHAVTLLVIPVAGVLSVRRKACPGPDPGPESIVAAVLSSFRREAESIAASDHMTDFVGARTRRVVTIALERAVDPLWTLIARITDPDARALAFTSYPRPAPCRFATEAYRADAAAAIGSLRFDVVHVMRSYMAPYADPFIASASATAAPRSSLDLDDNEAATHRRLAALSQQRGDPRDARMLTAEAKNYERHEAEWLPRFGRVFTCTDAHAAQVVTAHPGTRVAVVPNTIVLPPTLSRPARATGRHLLFVGNMSYLPNVDGIAAFVRDVLPELRARLGNDVVLRIAGSAPVPEIRELASRPGVELVADPPDLAPHYAWADVAVVPLSAGGGTRIKLIEAFAHGVPVVATTVGAEGVDALNGAHVLIADSTAAFVEACAELLADPTRAARIAGAARRLVEMRYSHAEGVRAIRAALEADRSGQTSPRARPRGGT